MKRVMSQKEMRKQTERKYKKCPEVKNKKIEIKRKQEYKTNKMMANLFNKVIYDLIKFLNFTSTYSQTQRLTLLNVGVMKVILW